jgi:hypothetical protein
MDASPLNLRHKVKPHKRVKDHSAFDSNEITFRSGIHNDLQTDPSAVVIELENNNTLREEGTLDPFPLNIADGKLFVNKFLSSRLVLYYFMILIFVHMWLTT